MVCSIIILIVLIIILIWWVIRKSPKYELHKILCDINTNCSKFENHIKYLPVNIASSHGFISLWGGIKSLSYIINMSKNKIAKINEYRILQKYYNEMTLSLSYTMDIFNKLSVHWNNVDEKIGYHLDKIIISLDRLYLGIHI